MLRSAATMAILFALLAWPSTLLSRTWHIEPDGTGDAPTIQAGIDSAATGDTVSLADGTYTGLGNRDLTYGGKAITVRSASGSPENCVIDCQSHPPIAYRRGFRFNSGEEPQAVVEGIGITNGWSNASNGGAILCQNASPTIIRCRFFGNYSGINGGAVACVGSSPIFIECVFDTNSAAFDGGGFIGFNSDALMEACVFRGNVAMNNEGGGAAFFEDSAPTIVGCNFTDNHATNGGGLYCLDSNPVLTGCVFRENIGLHGAGGGVILKNAVQPQIDSCWFEGNNGRKGGGIACWEGDSAPVIRHCTFVRNFAVDGAGVICKRSHPTIIGCTFYDNESDWGSAGCIMDYADPTIENTIMAFNYPGASIHCRDTTATVTLTCSDIYGNVGGDWVNCYADQAGVSGNFSADPVFCNPNSGDLTLDAFSPCLSAPGCGQVGAFGLGCGVVTTVITEGALPGTALQLLAWPNPARGSVSIRYSLSRGKQLNIQIYDIRGRVVRSMEAGGAVGVLIWDGANKRGHRVAPGVYFVRLSDGRATETRRVTLVR